MPSVCPFCSRSCLPCRIPWLFRPQMRSNSGKAGSCHGQMAVGSCMPTVALCVKSSCNVTGGNALCLPMGGLSRPVALPKVCRLQRNPLRLRDRMKLRRRARLGKRRASRRERAGGAYRARDSSPGKTSASHRRDRQPCCCQAGYGSPGRGCSLCAGGLQGTGRQKAGFPLRYRIQTGGRHGVWGCAGTENSQGGQRCSSCSRRRHSVQYRNNGYVCARHR